MVIDDFEFENVMFYVDISYNCIFAIYVSCVKKINKINYLEARVQKSMRLYDLPSFARSPSPSCASHAVVRPVVVFDCVMCYRRVGLFSLLSLESVCQGESECDRDRVKGVTS